MKDKSLVENNGSTENVKRTKIVVGLDIGTTKIACFVGKKNDHGKIEILSMGKSESLGVMSGVVSNIKQTVESIILAVKETQGRVEGELDERNWVWDFGGMKRAKNTIDGRNPKEWMDYMLDHTTIVTEDDPELEGFKAMERFGVIQLRILPAVGAERFAEYFYNKLNDFVQIETEGRVKVIQVEFRENEKNTAFYKG